VSQNITELIDYRKNLERKVEERTAELNAALNKEKELVKMKTQFVSIASHEFRTPLSSIAIAAGFIKKYKAKLTEETIEEKLINIEKQVNNMTYLLDDILTVGKGEAGKIPVNLKPLKLPEFITALIREVSRAVGNTHEIVLQEDYRSFEIVSDEKLLRNIFINLLTNAIKFSPHADKVDLRISTTQEQMKVTIRDYGIGIPKEDLSNLFQPFYRAGNAQAIQGTGLGLSIIKKAIDLLGGTIDVESNVGSGTEMRIQLPI
jgi:signal transduction histidine kinase